MFQTYIQILEILAMRPEGATVAQIRDVGVGMDRNSVMSHMKNLEQEGYVIADTTGRVNYWQVTEKAIEHCETVARKYAQSHVMDEIVDYVESASQNAIAPTQDAITEVSETPEAVDIMKGSVSFPLMGDETIAERVQMIEALTAVKVTKADLVDGVVTLHYKSIPSVNTEPEPEECAECGAPGTYHESWCPYNTP